jgi:SAM-dependent methyltransferase
MLWPIAVLKEAQHKSLLDVGCGFGFTADAWKHAFSGDAHGCDPAEYAAGGRALLGEHIHHAMLDDVPELAGRTFDIVYASEVIEHVPDPRQFVSLLAARASVDGVVALSTPAADYIRQRNDPSSVAAALAPGFHGFLFSRSALEALLKSQGFSYVVVEQHEERLVAWASNSPIVRVSPNAIVERYLSYLRGQVFGDRPRYDASERSRDALNSGFLYRYYKECVLRGIRDDLNELRKLVLSNLNVSSDTHIKEPEATALQTALVGIDEGVVEFGKHFRFNLPQLAFVLGIHAQAIDGDIASAENWYHVCELATEKLCKSTVLHGLEAAAFFWQAQMQLLRIDLATGRVEQACSRFVRMTEACETPDRRTGGSAPPPDALIALIGEFAKIPDASKRASLVAALGSVVNDCRATRFSDLTLCSFASNFMEASALPYNEGRISSLNQMVEVLPDRSGKLRPSANRLVNELLENKKPRSFASLASQRLASH